jgi:hypothetical protein
MKFTIGDCLAIRMEAPVYFAGIITSTMLGKYQLTLAEYKDEFPPPIGFFNNPRVFITKYLTGESPILALDVLSLSTEYLDQSDDVIIMDRVYIPTPVNSSGFKELNQFSELIEVYATALATLQVPNREESMLSAFETKCLMGLSDFVKSIPELNEFPTIKLYKNIGDELRYWQIYGSSTNVRFLVIGHGKLGESGDYVEISDRSLEELRETYRIETARKKREGYGELEDLHSMILQFQTTDSWGSTHDLDFRNEIWDYLDGILFWTGNGKISGGDIGSGTINLFFEAVEPIVAVNTIVEALKQKEIRQPYLIAQENMKLEIEKAAIRILHPKDFKGEFFY